jgi:hypothetical protein
MVKKNYVTITRRTAFPTCYDCHKKELDTEITDKKMKKMFNIPEEFYKKSAFLRDIKISFIRFGSLSDKQIEAFEKVVQDFKEAVKKE